MSIWPARLSVKGASEVYVVIFAYIFSWSG